MDAKGFTIMDDGYEWCIGDGGYDDLYFGTQVTVTDSTGQKVAIGELDAGRLSPHSARRTDSTDVSCSFEFLRSMSGLHSFERDC